MVKIAGRRTCTLFAAQYQQTPCKEKNRENLQMGRQRPLQTASLIRAGIWARTPVALSPTVRCSPNTHSPCPSDSPLPRRASGRAIEPCDGFPVVTATEGSGHRAGPCMAAASQHSCLGLGGGQGVWRWQLQSLFPRVDASYDGCVAEMVALPSGRNVVYTIPG